MTIWEYKQAIKGMNPICRDVIDKIGKGARLVIEEDGIGAVESKGFKRDFISRENVEILINSEVLKRTNKLNEYCLAF